MTAQSAILDDPKFRPVLDHGFVGLVDSMGDDTSIVRAARVSYGKGTKSVLKDRDLIRYLMRHRHCYHPTMEVLTESGWKQWGSCGPMETFLVPDPATRTLRKERLEVLSFDTDEEMFTFENERMSYCVTPDHKMWFKGKYQREFTKIRVQDMSRWGWFDPLCGYMTEGDVVGDGDDQFCFIGFFLGDGSGASTNRLSFHLRKPRKKEYLLDLLVRLGLNFSTSASSTHADAEVIHVETPPFIREWVDPSRRAADKAFPIERLGELTRNQIAGLFDGLVASDGHAPADRDRIEFASVSSNLARLVMALGAQLGFDAHLVRRGDGIHVVHVVAPGGTTLESRKQYHGRSRYSGRVFCATTSTGLLAVRGGPDKFGFVCGNTTPFEMVQVKLHVKAPILVIRQWFRHRTGAANEMSARYSEMEDEFYLPQIDIIQPQSTDNKQGRAGELSDRDREGVRWMMTAAYEHSHDTYKALLGKRDPEEFHGDGPIYDAYDGDEPLFDEQFPGIARELARAVLPVGGYSEFYWSQNLHNMLHFLTLRSHGTAQWEIRQFAAAMLDLIRPIAPMAVEAWEDYALHARTFSRMETGLLHKLIDPAKLDALVAEAGSEKALHESLGMSKREWAEFREKLAA